MKNRKLGAASFGLGMLAVFALGQKQSPTEILQEPNVVKLLGYMANAKTIDADGASGTNIEFELTSKWRFDVADQRHCWQVMARGIAENNEEYVQRAVKAIEYSFDHQTEEGRFGQSRWFETIGFLEAALRSHRLLLHSAFREKYEPILAKYDEPLRKAMHWLEITKDSEFKADWQEAPQHINVVAASAVTYLLAGEVLKDADLLAQGKKYVELALAQQQPNGVFPEGGGYDSSYQAVSLWHLSIYYFYSQDKDLNEKLFAALTKGWQWEKSRITAQGEVLTQGNQRTGPQGEIWRGKHKEVNYPEVCMALLYWAHIGKDQEAAELAPRVMDYGYKLYKEQRR